jgi:hypothetical protein
MAIGLAGAAYAGLNDGIRPGPSAPQWGQPARPRAPYALTGSTSVQRNPRDRQGWTRQAQQFGGKVTADVYTR